MSKKCNLYEVVSICHNIILSISKHNVCQKGHFQASQSFPHACMGVLLSIKINESNADLVKLRD